MKSAIPLAFLLLTSTAFAQSKPVSLDQDNSSRVVSVLGKFDETLSASRYMAIFSAKNILCSREDALCVLHAKGAALSVSGESATALITAIDSAGVPQNPGMDVNVSFITCSVEGTYSHKRRCWVAFP